MTSYLLAGPAIEPVSLAEAKTYCRIDGEDEDGLVATLVAAARIHVEGLTARALIAQSWRVVLDRWPPGGAVRLPVGPAMSLTGISAYDDAAAEHELDLGQFSLEPRGARMLLPRTVAGMPTLRARQGIEIDYVAGYGADAQDVPSDLRQAVLTLVAYWFENRDAVVVASGTTVAPRGFDRLVDGYRAVRL